MMKTKLKTVCLMVAFVAVAVVAQAVTIDLVPVGDAGNAPDTPAHSGNSNGQGAVGYNYNIGTYEVTAGQYTEFLNAVARTNDNYGLYNLKMLSDPQGCQIHRNGMAPNYLYTVPTNYDRRPVNYVSWGDAARFCNWLANGQPSTGSQDPSTTEDGSYPLNGAATDAALSVVYRKPTATWVIPTEDEWYKAAYYASGTSPSYWNYPTSSNTLPGRDINDPFGNNANYYDNPPYPIDPPYYTTVVGQFHNSPSPYGTFDQGGNVWEYNESIQGPTRGLRGGAHYIFSSSMLSSNRTATGPSYEDSSGFGFRVGSVPEPGSLIMLAGIAVTALLYYWRKHA